MTEVSTPLQGRRLDARFTLLEKLGSGGQGEVWRAHDETRGIDIALKVPANAAQGAGAVAAFEREHAIAARLNHASVLKVFPPHRSGDVVLLPMELATGGDLRRLRGAGYLDIIPVLLDIAQALEHAHERGVIHRDLKPGNVLFDARGGVKLADFGAAGTTSTTAEDARQQGLSPFTASPEQLRGEAPTESDDIYGLGALAYELLSGYPPYYPHFDLRRAQEEPVPNLVPTRQIPPLLSSLVMRMLAKDRRERPHSMREVIDDLDAALNDTLTFDFESLVDPTHGAPTAAVSLGLVSGARANADRGREADTPRAGSAQVESPHESISSGVEAVRDQQASDSNQHAEDGADEDDYDEEEPDLGLIPELLLANALVVTRKGSRSGSKQRAKPAESPGAPQGPAGETVNARQSADAAEAPNLARASNASPAIAAPQARSAAGVPQAANEVDAVSARQVADATGAANSARASRAPPSGAAQAQSASDAAQARNSAQAADSSQGANAGQASSAWPVADGAKAGNSTQAADASPGVATPKAEVAPARVEVAATRPSSESVINDTVHLSQDEVISARLAARGPSDQAAFNDTVQLPASTGLIDQAVDNDTVQLPSDPARGLRERIAAVRRATVNNDTMLLPPEETEGEPDGTAASPRASITRAAPERASQDRRSHQRRVRGQPTTAHATTQGASAKPPGPNTSSAAVLTSFATDAAIARAIRGTGAGTSGANAPGGAERTASTSNAATLNANAPGANVPGSLARGATSSAPSSTANGAGTGSANTSSTAASLRQPPAQQLHQPGLATAGLAAGAGGGANIATERPLWESLQLESVPRVAKLEPIRRRRWPIVLLGALAGIAVAVFYWLPRYAPQGLPIDLSSFTPHMSKSVAPAAATSTSPPDEATAATSSSADNSAEAKLTATRENFDRRLAALEARGAGVWGGAEFAMAKMRAAESVGAHDAGNTQMAQDRLADASHLLDQVESRASQALAAQLVLGEKALAAGQEGIANQAFELAKQIDPSDRRIADGQRRVHNLDGVLPLLADAQNAEGARNYSRAAQDYSKVLALDPGNEKARTSLAQDNAALGDDNYAKAVGSGYAALGAGRLDDARTAFEKARAVRPNGSEAADGLRRVGVALSAKGFASVRQRAASLEAQERWDEAVQLYDSALQSDPSLAFAQEGKDRAAARAELAASMQALIDRPERLSSQSVRNQARALLDTANAQSPSGPVLRSQIARLGMLLPDYDSSAWRGTARTDLLEKPVRLSLVSDNATAVTIPSIGQFGTFAKRDIELKPGRYTVIGTRDGYRDVHRDITISPGQESQTISVSCSDPI